MRTIEYGRAFGDDLCAARRSSSAEMLRAMAEPIEPAAWKGNDQRAEELQCPALILWREIVGKIFSGAQTHNVRSKVRY